MPSTLARAHHEFLKALDEKALREGREKQRDIAKAVQAYRYIQDDLAFVPSSQGNRKVWILHPNAEKTPYFATLSAGHFELRGFATEALAEAALKQDRPSLILVAMEFETFIRKLHDKSPDVHLILLGNDDISASISFLQTAPRLYQMVFEHAFDSIFMQESLLSSCEKLVSGDIFGLEKHLDYGAEVLEAIISGNESRRQALEKLAADLGRAGLSNVLIHKAHHLADELLMNAIYDAPVDKKTRAPRYNHLTRSVSVELDPSEYARLRYGFDGTVLALSIEDPFGALPRDIILKYLKSCYEGQFGKLNEKEGKGGGGMGLYQIMSSADLFVANVVPDVKTEIIVLINVHERLPLRTHSFHYFTRTNDSAQNPGQDEVRTKLLPQILEKIETLSAADDKTIAEIMTLKSQVEKLSKASKLKPVPDAKSILLLSSNKRHQRTVKAILGVSDYELSFYETYADLPKAPLPSLIAIDDTICDATLKLRPLPKGTKCVAFSDKKSETALDDLMKYPDLEQVFSLDLPKVALHKLLLNHFKRLLGHEASGVASYLSYGARVQKLEANSLQNVVRSEEEKECLQHLQRALTDLIKADSSEFGYDPHVFAMSRGWKEPKTREEWLSYLHPGSPNPLIQKLYEYAHALVFSTDGQRNELIALRFLSNEEISEPFLYTFFTP